MTTGTVKFFNPAKGFGFIAPDDGGPDVFVHISAVERAGLSGLGEGDEVSFEVEADRRSGWLAAIDLILIRSGGAEGRGGHARPAAGFPRQSRGGVVGGGSRSQAGGGSGVVKWFNAQKGFGFIQPHDGGGDVFVHISAVERSGLGGLSDGQSVTCDLQEDRRTGKLAATNLRRG